MSKWKVVITPEAAIDIKNIYTYIADELHEKNTARELSKRIINEIEALSEMPKRFPLYDMEPWNSRGLRKMLVGNFLVFYFTNDSVNEVAVFHVFYAGRNIDEMLK